MSVAVKEIKLAILGMTGVGKSALSNRILKSLKSSDQPFEEGPDAEACTQNPKMVTHGEYVLIDNPGVLDPRGDKEDESNIRKIVSNAKTLKYVNAFALLLNCSTPRYDLGMQSTMKLFVDSFGKEALNRFCIIYTKCHEEDNVSLRTRLQKKIDFIIKTTNEQCDTHMTKLPFYIVECHPEEYDIDDREIQTLEERTTKEIAAFLRWASANPPYSTLRAIYGEFDHVRAERELQAQIAAEKQKTEDAAARARSLEAEVQRGQKEMDQKLRVEEKKNADTSARMQGIEAVMLQNQKEMKQRMLEEQKRADEQRQRFEDDQIVVGERTEQQTVEVTTDKRQVLKNVQVQRERAARSFLVLFGHTKTETVTEVRVVGEKNTVTKKTEERKITKYRSGREVPGEWVVIRTWTEEK